MYEKLLVKQNGDAMRVAFNSPHLHDAMDSQMLEALGRAVS